MFRPKMSRNCLIVSAAHLTQSAFFQPMQTRTHIAKQNAAEFRAKAREYRRVAMEQHSETDRNHFLMLADSLELLAAEYDALCRENANENST